MFSLHYKNQPPFSPCGGARKLSLWICLEMWVGCVYCVWGLLSVSSWLINPLTQKSWITLGGQSKAFHFGHYPWLILFKCLQCFEVSVNKEISWHTWCQHLYHNLMSWFASDIIDFHVLLRLRFVQRSQTVLTRGAARGTWTSAELLTVKGGC